MIAASLCACTFLTGGCAGEIRTLPNRAYTATDGALEGEPYALPKVRYEVKLRRSLAECPGASVGGKPTALKFAISAEATPAFLAGESYIIDYQKLPGWLRIANFEIKRYENGTLKSIGVAGEDKTAETISSVAKTALSLATIIGLSDGELPRGATRPSQIVTCTDTAAALIADARKTETDLKTLTGQLEVYEKSAERYRAAGAARTLDAAGRAKFLALFDNIAQAEADIALLKKKQSDLAGDLGVSETIVWEGGATNPGHAKRYPLKPAHLAKLEALLTVASPPAAYPLDDAEVERQRLMKPCFGAAAGVTNCLNAQLALRSGLYLERDLKPCGEEGAAPPECLTEIKDSSPRYRRARDEVADAGIFVRDPVVGRLLFCREAVLPVVAAVPPVVQPAGGADIGSAGTQGGTGSAGTGAGGLEGMDPPPQPGAAAPAPGGAAPASAAQTSDPLCTLAYDEAKIAAGDFPQFGQLRFLPFRVGMFQAREMAVFMTEKGRVETFSYKSTKAPAQALAGAGADVAGQAEAFLEKRETEARDDLKYAREQKFAELQQDITRLTKEQELKKLQTPPAVDPLQATRDETAAIAADIALLKAKLERLQTEAALAAMTGASGQ